jgi:hypothetical protein
MGQQVLERLVHHHNQWKRLGHPEVPGIRHLESEATRYFRVTISLLSCSRNEIRVEIEAQYRVPCARQSKRETPVSAAQIQYRCAAPLHARQGQIQVR